MGGFTLNGENWPLVTGEPVEFEKWQVEVQGFGNVREIYGVGPRMNVSKPERSQYVVGLGNVGTWWTMPGKSMEKFIVLEIYRFREIYGVGPRINEVNPKDRSMSLVGLGNAETWRIMAVKSAQTLTHILNSNPRVIPTAYVSIIIVFILFPSATIMISIHGRSRYSWFRAGLHHGPWKMAFCPWSDFKVQHPMVRFLKKSIYKAFGSFIRCELNVDQEEWPCTKSECAYSVNICSKRVVLKKKSKFHHSLAFCCLRLLFPP